MAQAQQQTPDCNPWFNRIVGFRAFARSKYS
jgi:hypothetical protein